MNVTAIFGNEVSTLLTATHKYDMPYFIMSPHRMTHKPSDSPMSHSTLQDRMSRTVLPSHTQPLGNTILPRQMSHGSSVNQMSHNGVRSEVGHFASRSNVVSLFPPPAQIIDGVLAIITAYQWKDVVILYHDTEGR